MLVLSLKVGQRVVITDEPTGKKVVVMLCTTGQDKGKLGIEAPADMKIMREELIEADR